MLIPKLLRGQGRRSRGHAAEQLEADIAIATND